MFDSRIDYFFKRLNISKMLLKSNFYKESGICCVDILKTLFYLSSQGKNIYCPLVPQTEDLLLEDKTSNTHKFIDLKIVFCRRL